MLTKEELKNIGILLATGKFNITGNEANLVSDLLKKISSIHNGMPNEVQASPYVAPEEPKEPEEIV